MSKSSEFFRIVEGIREKKKLKRSEIGLTPPNKTVRTCTQTSALCTKKQYPNTKKILVVSELLLRLLRATCSYTQGYGD